MTIIKEKAYVLCSCETFEGQPLFEEGKTVEAKDWDPLSKTSGSLFGLLWGNGTWEALLTSEDVDWAVVKVTEYVKLSGYVKFPRGVVVFRGSQKSAVKKIVELGARSGTVLEDLRVDDSCLGVVGDLGTIEGGKGSVVVAGEYGKASVDEYGTALSGLAGRSVVKKMGFAASGDYGKAIIEEGDGVAISGYRGESSIKGSGLAVSDSAGCAFSGEEGISLSLDYGKSSVEDYGLAITGPGGIAKAGKDGIIAILWYERKNNRERLAVGHVGEDGIKPNTYYRVERGKLAPVKEG